MSIKFPGLSIVWRDGRPRYVPSPAARAAGFKGRDLRHPDGRWFSAEEAEAFGQARRAELTQRAAGATAPPFRRPLPAERTVEDLLLDFLGSRDFLRKPRRTQDDYRTKAYAIRFRPLPRKGRARDAARTPEPFAHVPARAIGAPEAKAFFEYLERTRGLAMARGAMMVLSAAFKWGRLDQTWRLTINPVLAIGMPKPAPRVITWEIAEVQAFVRAADHPAVGEQQLADAVILALFSGQREGDLLAFDGASVSAGVIRLVQTKRGRHVEVPIIAPLAARLAAMAERRLVNGVTAPTLLWDGRSGAPWKPFGFRHRFLALRRRVAAGIPEAGIAPCPALAGKNFHALRKTLLTWLKRAGARDDQFAAVSGHALASLPAVIGHYYAPGAAQASEAMVRLEAWLAEQGIAV